MATPFTDEVSVKILLQNGDVRRFSIAQDRLTYQDLLDMAATLDSSPISSRGLQYLDEEDDWITFTSDREFMNAVRCSPNNCIKIRNYPQSEDGGCSGQVPAEETFAETETPADMADMDASAPSLENYTVEDVIKNCPVLVSRVGEDNLRKMSMQQILLNYPRVIFKLRLLHGLPPMKCGPFMRGMHGPAAAGRHGFGRGFGFGRAGGCVGPFIAEVTENDKTDAQPGRKVRLTKPKWEPVKATPLSKLNHSWTVRNESDSVWNENGEVTLCYRKGYISPSTPQTVKMPKSTSPGEEVTFTVPIVAPQHQGKYVTVFRLNDGKRFFGPPLRGVIQVGEADSGSDMESYQTEMESLHAMGFENDRLNRRLLNKFDGNLPQVVFKLTKKQEKNRDKREEREHRRPGHGRHHWHPHAHPHAMHENVHPPHPHHEKMHPHAHGLPHEHPHHGHPHGPRKQAFGRRPLSAFAFGQH